MKQATSNPWDEIKNSLQVDKIHEGEITNITEFGLFIKLTKSASETPTVDVIIS